MTKQELIEQKLDENAELRMGQELNALLSLAARQAVAGWQENKMIQEFSESLGFTHHLDTALRILRYMYPENRIYWTVQDKRYKEIVDNSAWLQWNFKNK